MFVTRTLAVAVTVVGLTLAVAAIPTNSPQDRATAWAKSLSPAERQMYARAGHVAGIPAEYRKAVFAALSTADEQASFWQGVFTTYRRQHVLSPTQDATLKRAEAMIPAVFGARPSERAAQEPAVTRVSDEVKRVLESQAHRELFLMAGPDGRTGSLPIAERVMLQARRWSHTNAVARAAGRIVPTVFAAGNCNCNAGKNDCTYFMTCTEGLNSCEQVGGCACEWIFFN